MVRKVKSKTVIERGCRRGRWFVQIEISTRDMHCAYNYEYPRGFTRTEVMKLTREKRRRIKLYHAREGSFPND